MRDVIIIGGGPGGLQTARLLASGGFDVALYEEHASSGDPVHCTGVLAVEAFDELGLPRDVILNPLKHLPILLAVRRDRRAHDAANRGSRHRPAGVRSLALRRSAQRRRHRSCSAAVRPTPGVDESGVTVALNDGTRVRGRACVLACGAQYAIQRRLGLGLPAVFLQSAQMELPCRTCRRRRSALRRDGSRLEASPGRCRSSRPSGSFARVGLMCERQAGLHFRRLVQEISTRWGIDGRGSRRRLRSRLARRSCRWHRSLEPSRHVCSPSAMPPAS